MSNQVSTRLVSIPDTRTIQTLWHVHLLTILTVFLCTMSVSQPILSNWVIQNWFCSYRRILWKKTESKKKAESAGDDWRYTKGHLNPYYNLFITERRDLILSFILYQVHFLRHPLITKTETHSVFPYVSMLGLNYAMLFIIVFGYVDRSLADIWKYFGMNLPLAAFFIIRNWRTSAKEKEKKKGESRAKDRSGWAMWYNVYLNPYIITECEFLCSVKIEGQFV